MSWIGKSLYVSAGISDRNVNLFTYFPAVPRLRASGAVHPFRGLVLIFGQGLLYPFFLALGFFFSLLVSQATRYVCGPVNSHSQPQNSQYWYLFCHFSSILSFVIAVVSCQEHFPLKFVMAVLFPGYRLISRNPLDLRTYLYLVNHVNHEISGYASQILSFLPGPIIFRSNLFNNTCSFLQNSNRVPVI